MSKPNIRKITADPTKCNTDSRRPSVFERLGTKPATAATAAAPQNTSDYCRNWALNGSCSYGKSCKYANTHTLISPSKRAKKDNAIASTAGLIEDPFKRLTSKIVKKASHSPDLNIEEWNQTDLEYEDEKVLERRRQLLQRELELQMKKDKEVHGKDKVRQKKKAMSTSSSSRTSSTSSSSSSSSSEDSSSTSTSDSRKKVKKIKTKRHHSVSTDYDEDKEKKKKLKLKRLGAKNDKAVSKKKRKLESSSTKKDPVARSIKKYASSSSVSKKHSTSLRARSPVMQGSASGITSTTTAVLGSSVSVAHHTSSSSNKNRERNRSESPKALKSAREMDKEDGNRHYKKVRDVDECLSKDTTAKCKSFDKVTKEQEKDKSRAIDEKIKSDDSRLRSKCKDKDNVRSRTPPPSSSSDRSNKHQHVKESTSKTRRSRTPDKSSRSRRDLTPAKNPEKQGGGGSSSSSNRARDAEKKDRDSHKQDKSKEREDARKNEQLNSGKQTKTMTSSQDDSYRRNANKDFDDKTYGSGEKTARQKSRERREKETREEQRGHSTRLPRDQREPPREPPRDKDKDESQERCRERQRERDRDRERDRERERERDRDRDRDRDRERDRERERERERERDREREKSMKSRERDVPATVVSSTLSLSTDKNSRYSRNVKERPLSKDVSFEKSGTRERRSERERERSETKALGERERNSTQRLDGRYERGVVEKDASRKSNVNSPRDRMDRFPRESSLDRTPLHDKNTHPAVVSSGIQSTAGLSSSVPAASSSSSTAVATPGATSSSRDHLMDMVEGSHYDRDNRHRRFGARYERGHASERKDQTRIERVPSKIDRMVERRDATSPRRAMDIDRNFNRNYGRISEHWDEQDETSGHVEYRDHAHIHEEDRRKAVDGRRYDSPFEERRVARDERSRESRYVIQTTERASFDDHRHHHHHHRHPLYTGDKLRSSGTSIRDEGVSNDDWEGHHRDVEHTRDRGYPTVEWEDREWRTRTLWEGRDSLPRSEIHDDEWNSRYDGSIADWKSNDTRKWDNQNVHVRSHYRNERSKDLELGESTQHSKRRSYNPPETREEPAIHPSAKQAAIYGSMKEEPINKKLMELAEGKLCTTREKSTDSFQKKNLQKEKPEIKEPVVPEPKRVIADESLQTLHTESDLSDISDDPDDILNMEEDTADIETGKARASKKVPDTTHAQSAAQELAQLSPKEPVEEAIFNAKSKDNADTVSLKNMEDDNMETMDFEEISDGELEEDIKTSGKGLGDALGVDWESLVKETQAKRMVTSTQDSAENRWQCKAIFYRIGISKKYAGEDFVKKLLKKYEKNDHKECLLDNIALMHTALARNRLLQDLGNVIHSVDDSLYRNNTTSYDEDVDYDWETLKPSNTLYEEAKCLLQQVI